MDDTVLKKKRGRKPKNNIIVNDNPEFLSNNNELIVKLNINDIDENMLENNNIPTNEVFEKKVSEVCWNCCHDFHNNNIYSIPIKYSKNIFHIYGDFCSLECGLRYIHDTFKTNKYLEILSYTTIYNKLLFDNVETISMAPHKLLLSKFGGPLSIEDYRIDASKYNNYFLNIPIGTQVYHTINLLNETKTNESSVNLRLYRKNENKDNDIQSIMNL